MEAETSSRYHGMARLYRTMRCEPDGFPRLEASARALGVRPGIDVPVAQPHAVVRPGDGGISVAPQDPGHLPPFRRPPGFGGTGKDPVFGIDESELGPDLAYRPDPDDPGHGFIEPARAMTLAEYEAAVEQTRYLWQHVSPP